MNCHRYASGATKSDIDDDADVNDHNDVGDDDDNDSEDEEWLHGCHRIR